MLNSRSLTKTNHVTFLEEVFKNAADQAAPCADRVRPARVAVKRGSHRRILTCARILTQPQVSLALSDVRGIALSNHTLRFVCLASCSRVRSCFQGSALQVCALRLVLCKFVQSCSSGSCSQVRALKSALCKFVLSAFVLCKFVLSIRALKSVLSGSCF